jgi:O-antigen/teichoic acid export membrane protein
VLALSLWSAPGSTSAWFAVALAPLFVFNFLGSGLLIGLQQMKAYSVTQILSTGVVLPFLLVAAALGAGPAGFLAASAVAWSITIAVMVVVLLRQSSGIAGFRPDVFVMTFRYSTKVYLATLAGFLVLRINVFVLGAIGGTEEVGYYSIASQGADALGILPQSFATVLFPQLVANRAGRLSATLRAAARAAALLTVACAVVWVAAEPVIRVAFGPAFLPAVPVLHAMLPSVFLLGVVSVVSQYLAASGFPISVVASWIGAVVLGTMLSFILIDLHGAVGAAEALSLTYAALLAALLVLCWRTAAAAGQSQRDLT